MYMCSLTECNPLSLPFSHPSLSLLSLPPSSFFSPLLKVDAHNIVPVWVASDKQEYAARTIRSKIHKLLPEFLTGFPPITVHTYNSKLAMIVS